MKVNKLTIFAVHMLEVKVIDLLIQGPSSQSDHVCIISIVYINDNKTLYINKSNRPIYNVIKLHKIFLLLRHA